MTRRCFGLKSLSVCPRAIHTDATPCRAARRQDASTEKTLPHVDYVRMFTSGSVQGFGFVFHFTEDKKKKGVFTALTLLVGSANKQKRGAVTVFLDCTEGRT